MSLRYVELENTEVIEKGINEERKKERKKNHESLMLNNWTKLCNQTIGESK